MKQYKMLIGATKYNELVFAEFGVRERNGKKEFSASFDTVSPSNVDDIDLVEHYETVVEDMMYDGEWLWNSCQEYNCKPWELADEMAGNCYDVRDAIDCSLYPEMYNIDDTYWVFESCGCGQHDTREDGMAEYVNEQAYYALHDLWDNYHLKEVNDSVIEQVDKIADALGNINEEEWITDYIRRVIM